jgi:hypothetical protein
LPSAVEIGRWKERVGTHHGPLLDSIDWS